MRRGRWIGLRDHLGRALRPRRRLPTLRDQLAGSRRRRKKRIIAILGQSNAVGRKFIEQVSEPEKTKLTAPLATVTLREWESTNATPPVLLYDTATGLGSRSVVRSDGPLSPRPYALPVDNMGFELSLGHYLDDNLGDDVAIVKFGIGGTSLAVNWLPTGTYPAAGAGNLFNQSVDYLQQMEADYGGYIACIVWCQGENDALNATDAGNYETNLTALIAAYRVHFPGVPFVFNRLSSSNSGAHKAAVRTGQTNVATNVAGTRMTDWDSYVPLDGGQHLIPNFYVAAGYAFGPPVVNAMGGTLPLVADFSFEAPNLDVDFTDRSSNPNVTGIPVAPDVVSEWEWDFGDGDTSTDQHPSHTYPFDGAYTVRLVVRDAAGVPAATTKTITVAAPSWTYDATSLRGRPANASEWTALRTAHGLATGNPKNLYLFDEASGSILDKIGSKNLAFGANAPGYRKTKSGWSSWFIGASGASVSVAQACSNTTFANVNATACAILVYLTFNTTATNRQQVAGGASGVNELEVGGGTNFARKRTGGAGKNTTLSHVDVVRPYILRYSNTPALDELFSDIEKIALAYAAAAGTVVTVNFSLANNTTVSTDVTYLARFDGADAELPDADFKHLLQSLGWPVTGWGD